MGNWKKINAYTRFDQALLRKDLLIKNDIEAFIIDKQDSAFLLGDVNVYVKEEDFDNATELINEFEGWSRINNFTRSKPVNRLKAVIEELGIETLFLHKEDEENQLKSFELYVSNKNKNKAISHINNLPGWESILTFPAVTQAAYRDDILEDNNIPTLVLKKRNKKQEITGVIIYVQEFNVQEAHDLINTRAGWELFGQYQDNELWDKHNKILVSNNIPVWEETNDEAGYKLIYVPSKNYDHASEVIEIHTNWVDIKEYQDPGKAQLDKDFLNKNNIESTIINYKDSAFLLGSLHLFVKEESVEEAKKLLEKVE